MENGETNSLRKGLLEECYAMVKHLSSDGREIPAGTEAILKFNKKNFDEVDLTDDVILRLHKSLSKKVAPAHPRSLWLLYEESGKGKWLGFLGPIVLVRRLMLVALISLALFVLISMSPNIDYTNIKNGIYLLSGFRLFILLSFYLTSASLGASFSNLFQANRYIVRNTFDPKYESSYWIRFVLGVIAGILLAVVIPMPEIDESNRGTAMEAALMSRPVLAMLGGFSASLVNRILFRLVYAVESVFIGKQTDETEQKIAAIKESQEFELAGNRQEIANKLLALQGQINNGKSTQEISEEINKVLSGLTGSE